MPKEKFDKSKAEAVRSLGISEQTIRMNQIVFTDALRAAFEEEFDENRIEYAARAITKGIMQVSPVVVRPIEGTKKTQQYELLHKPAMIMAMDSLGIPTADVIVIKDRDFSVETATPDQLNALGEFGAKLDRIEKIQVKGLLLDGKIIDDEHKGKLEEQMGSQGQKVPIWVRARKERGKFVFDVIDGYHRSTAAAAINLKLFLARVSYNMSDEELYDQRVIAANSVGSVQYARVVTWMQKSFDQSVWKLQYGMKLSQILGIAWNVSQNQTKNPGRNLGLSESESEAAIRWANEKVLLWQGKLGTIYQQILAAESSFPDIIEQVRRGSGGGHKGQGIFNPDKFIALAKTLPDDHDLQIRMLSIIREHNINAREVEIVGQAMLLVRGKKEDMDMLMVDPVAVAEEIVRRSEKMDLQEELPAHAVVFEHPKSASAKTVKRQSIRRGKEEKEERSPSLLKLTITPQQNGEGSWWRTLDLPELERTILIMMHEQGKFTEEIAAELSMTEAKVESYITSANRRHALAIRNANLLAMLQD